MDKKDNSKFLYFDNGEIDKEETDNKQVFVTKRMKGQETHNIKKQIKVEKNNKNKVDKLDRIELKDDEFIIDIPSKYIEKEKPKKSNNSRKNKKETKTNTNKNTSKSKGKQNKKKQNESKIEPKSRKTNSTKKVESKKNIKKVKKKKKSNNIAKVITLLFIIVAIGIFAMITPIFNITTIEVTGNEKVNTQSIISLSGLKTGENIFKNLKSSVENNIKDNSYINEANMKLKLPGTVLIEVRERKIEYQLKVLDSYVYIDNQGYILEVSDTEENVPIIEGYKTEDNEVLKNKRLNNEDLLSLNSVLKIMNAARSIELDTKIEKINIEDNKDYKLFLENKQIYIGDETNLSNKMGHIQMVLEDIKETGGIIFVNGDFNNGFKAYFRPE